MRTHFRSPLRRPAAQLLGLLALTQCKENEVAPSLPPESTTGANTSGCLVDGQVLVPRDIWTHSGTSLSLGLGTTAATADFALGIVDFKNDSSPLILLTADSLVLEEGHAYPITFSPHRGVVQAMCTAGEGQYYTTRPSSGTLTITRLDRQAKLLAGRFDFVATDNHTGRQVTVTQGRFDYKTE